MSMNIQMHAREGLEIDAEFFELKALQLIQKGRPETSMTLFLSESDYAHLRRLKRRPTYKFHCNNRIYRADEINNAIATYLELRSCQPKLEERNAH